MSGFGKQVALTSAIVAVLVVGVGLGLYYALPALSKGTGSNYMIEGGNQTAVATYVNTFTGMTSTSSVSSSTTSGAAGSTNTATVTSTSSIPPQNSFTYSPANSDVRILSVQAFASQDGTGGQTTLSFSVQFENIGTQTIYVTRAGVGSGLTATILSGDVRTQATVMCMIAEAPTPISPGSNNTVETPTCSTGHDYILLQPGTVEVELTLSWSTGDSTQSPSTVTITADFYLG